MSPGVMFSTLPDEFLPWGNVYLAPGGGQGRRDPTPTEHPPPPPPRAPQVLEACMKNCGRRFHNEVGKFRFLNELIKVVSPKVCRAVCS